LKSEEEVTSLSGADKREVRDNREKWWEYREKSKYLIELIISPWFTTPNKTSALNAEPFKCSAFISVCCQLYCKSERWYANKNKELNSQGIIVAFVCYNVLVMHQGIFSSCLIPCFC
jgi:uncharacterized protein VirK/YbjX